MQTPPTFHDLFGLFPAGDLPRHAEIAPHELPPPYRQLLEHRDHMTVTLDRFFGAPVAVRVLASGTADGDYARHILLTDSASGRAVQFGAVRICLNLLPEKVCQTILTGRTPLGRILTEHNVLTCVQPTAYLRVHANAALAAWCGIPESTLMFGRLGVIYADGRPAIEVLEVLSPIAADADADTR